MKVELPSCFLPCLQDPTRGVRVEHPLLTEDVDVVHSEGGGNTELMDSRNLNVNDVLSSLACCAASVGEGDVCPGKHVGVSVGCVYGER